MRRILAVDDEQLLLSVLSKLLTGEGYEVVSALGGEQGHEALKKQPFDLMVSDIRMAGIDGIELLRRAHEEFPLMPVILVTAYASVKTATMALKLGAFDYATKPIRIHGFLRTIRRAMACASFLRVNEYVRDPSAFACRFDDMVAESDEMRQVCELISRAAVTDGAVLISGESGVGKELVAKTIHKLGHRHDKGFRVVNCADIPEPLLDMTLFGAGDGGDSGGGLLFSADCGTLLLDEVGMMPPAIQGKLLAAIRDKGTSAGARKTEGAAIHAQIIVTTTPAPETLVQQGALLDDLYRSLSGMMIAIPPLRSRTEDILPLAANLLRRRFKNWDDIPKLTPDVAAALVHYTWPGNVHELANVVEQMAAHPGPAPMTRNDLPKKIVAAVVPDDSIGSPYLGRGEYWAMSLKAYLREQLKGTASESAVVG